MDHSNLIVRDPKVCNGQPVLVGTRVELRTILASLAEGDTEVQILQSFPTLKPEHIRAAVAFAAESAVDDMPYAGTPSI